MPLKLVIWLSREDGVTLDELKFWDSTSPHDGPPTGHAIRERGWGDSADKEKTFKETGPRVALAALFLHALAGSDPLTHRLNGKDHFETGSLVEAFRRETIKAATRPWPQNLFLPKGAPKPLVAELRKLFFWRSAPYFEFRLTEAWRNRTFEAWIGDCELPPHLYWVWGDALRTKAKALIQQNPTLDDVGVAPAPILAVSTPDLIIHFLAAPQALARTLAGHPLPNRSDLAGFSVYQLQGAAGTMAIVAAAERATDSYAVAFQLERWAAHCSRIAKDWAKAIESFLQCMSDLRPLGLRAETRAVAFTVEALLKRDASLVLANGPRFLGELASLCFEHGDTANARPLAQAADACYRRAIRRLGPMHWARTLEMQSQYSSRRVAQIKGWESLGQGLSEMSVMMRRFRNLGDTRGYANSLLCAPHMLIEHGKLPRALAWMEKHESGTSASSLFIRAAYPGVKGWIMQRTGGSRDEAEQLLVQSIIRMSALDISPPLKPGGPWLELLPHLALRADHPSLKDIKPLRLRGSMPFTNEELNGFARTASGR